MNRPGSVRARVEQLLTAVSFVDIYGRPIGYDYAAIVKMIKRDFPHSRISVKVLKDWYTYRMQGEGKRLPVRRKSRKVLVRDYTRTLLLQNKDDLGLSLRSIKDRVRKKFPGVTPLSLGHVEAYLIRRGHRVPFRPPIKVVDYD